MESPLELCLNLVGIGAESRLEIWLSAVASFALPCGKNPTPSPNKPSSRKVSGPVMAQPARRADLCSSVRQSLNRFRPELGPAQSHPGLQPRAPDYRCPGHQLQPHPAFQHARPIHPQLDTGAGRQRPIRQEMQTRPAEVHGSPASRHGSLAAARYSITNIQCDRVSNPVPPLIVAKLRRLRPIVAVPFRHALSVRQRRSGEQYREQ